ncbi:MAG: hypothetical protein RLY43_2512 [Bacteroidota bacterium]|jgi:hypothetical protein
MENKSTTKATMRKAHFITSMVRQFPTDIAEFVIEISPEEFTNWNADTLHELEFNFFQIPQKKIFEKIEFFIETVEVESDGDNQLLTIRFILVGNLKIQEMEDVGVSFRNQILTEFGGNLYLKLNKQVDPLDFIITISPLQLINHRATSLFPDWLIEKVLSEPIMALPKSFFINGQHKQLTTSFL